MFKDVNTVVFDLDGTIYHGNELIEGALDTVLHVRRKGMRVFFVTNNSTKTRQQIYETLKEMRVTDSCDEVYTSGYIAAHFIKKKNISDIYVIGSDNLKKEFYDAGIELSADEHAQNLFIGFTTNFNYDELTTAFRIARNAKKMIVANIDQYFPGKDGKLFPGCGAIVKAVEYASDRDADFIIGKPNTYILEYLYQKYQLNNKEVLIVGDVYESDIIMANAIGSPSILIGNTPAEGTCNVSKISDIINLI